jgi:hypothetical protein
MMTFTRFLAWTGTALVLAGAVATSLRIDPLNIYLLNIGSASFLWWAWRIQDRAMIAVNGGLLVIYLVGLFFER